MPYTLYWPLWLFVVAMMTDQLRSSLSMCRTISIFQRVRITGLFYPMQRARCLTLHKLEKSDTYLFTSSTGYSENSVTMTILQYSVRGSGPFGYCQLFTYGNVPFGDYGYTTGPSMEAQPIKGTTRWAIQDASLDNYHTIGLSSPVGSLSSLESNYADNSIYYNASIRTDETAFLLTRWDMGSLYYLEKRIVPGRDYVNTLADFKKAEVKPMSIPKRAL